MPCQVTDRRRFSNKPTLTRPTGYVFSAPTKIAADREGRGKARRPEARSGFVRTGGVKVPNIRRCFCTSPNLSVRLLVFGFRRCFGFCHSSLVISLRVSLVTLIQKHHFHPAFFRFVDAFQETGNLPGGRFG